MHERADLAAEGIPAVHREGRPAHIVDVLIEERAPHLRAQPLVWFLIRHLLYPLLKYDQAIQMADAIGALPGQEILERVANGLDLQLVIAGLDQVPSAGACMIVANHPTGIADGLALYQALRGVRDDLVFVANQDALRVAPGLADCIIPVEWVVEKRTLAKTRVMWRQVREAFKNGKAVVMFPSGRVAQLRGTGLVDRPWQSAAMTFATRNAAPIVPLHIGAWNSWVYYLFSRLSPELRDITLFEELLNKRGRQFRLTFGAPIMPSQLGADPESEMLRLRRFVEIDLPAGRPWSA